MTRWLIVAAVIFVPPIALLGYSLCWAASRGNEWDDDPWDPWDDGFDPWDDAPWNDDD